MAFFCSSVHVVFLQAVLEYHLFQPPTPPGGAAALLRLFAAYWESGAARIGEKGARGWAYWCCWHAMGMEQPAAAADGEEEAQQQQQEQVSSEIVLVVSLLGWASVYCVHRYGHMFYDVVFSVVVLYIKGWGVVECELMTLKLHLMTAIMAPETLVKQG